jgi:hypothetical protein
MSEAQRALLQQIAEGCYLPYIHSEYTTLAWLYRHRYISYVWYNVQITAAGKEALQQAVNHAPR